MAKKRTCRILVGDDDVSVLRFLEKALAHFGFESLVCQDGAQVLQRAEPGAVSLLLLDYRIGKPDGVEIVTTLRDRGIAILHRGDGRAASIVCDAAAGESRRLHD